LKEKEVEDASLVLNLRKEELAKLDASIGPITEEELLEMSKNVVRPGIEKYKKLLMLPPPGEGEVATDLMRSKQAFLSAKVFDVLYLATGPHLQSLEMLVDGLKDFGYPEFTESFLSDMKKEIPYVLELAKKEFNWEAAPESRTYRSRAVGRSLREKKRAMMDAEAEVNREEGSDGLRTFANLNISDLPLRSAMPFKDWEDDPAERARRIYFWWQVHILGKRSGIYYFSEALRLIVLSQPSSAAIERVFSQLQYIRRVCGDRTMADLLNLRLLIRCNDGLVDSFEDM
jgi:hypothetical protein